MLLPISLHFVVQDSQKDFQKKKKIFPQDAESWIFISQDFSEFRFSEFALSRSQLNSSCLFHCKAKLSQAKRYNHYIIQR